MADSDAEDSCEDETDPRNLQILHAARDGLEAVAQRLLQDQSQPAFPINSARQGGHTALSLAAESGHAGMVRLLLEHGAEVGTRKKPHGSLFFTRRGLYTPLYFAAYSNHSEVVRILIAAGANVDGGVEGSGHNHPVSLAARLGHEEVLRVLLENGAPAEFREPKSKPSLCWAAEDGLDSIVELLLEYGADVNYPDFGGMTPLSWAAQAGQLRTVKILLAHGANIHAVDNRHASTVWVVSLGGQTALAKAAWMGQAEVARCLLQHGADSNWFDFWNKCPLVYAARGGHFETVRVLLEHDPKPTIAGPEGLTALEVGLREFKKLDPPEWYDDMWELLEPADTRHRPGTFEKIFGFKLG
ncbi:hypothetical protein FE257_009712 [Aspergillus nanangensis]|uniref:Uncharacterized protein n=1 Tax=Aspergillus nanangensis TaxID=2582783 RepID=A0AAD4CJC2_ASPNN|nr:hypothetical protein FE257_009712 [Aspergillus nanangensis]